MAGATATRQHLADQQPDMTLFYILTVLLLEYCCYLKNGIKL